MPKTEFGRKVNLTQPFGGKQPKGFANWREIKAFFAKTATSGHSVSILMSGATREK